VLSGSICKARASINCVFALSRFRGLRNGSVEVEGFPSTADLLKAVISWRASEYLNWLEHVFGIAGFTRSLAGYLQGSPEVSLMLSPLVAGAGEPFFSSIGILC